MMLSIALSNVARGCFIVAGCLVSARVVAAIRQGPPLSDRPHVEDTTGLPIRKSDSVPLSVIGLRRPFRADRMHPKPVQVVDGSDQADTREDITAARITGFVMGASAVAIVEGVPGVPGAVAVRIGDNIGGWHVRNVTTSTVVLEQAGRPVYLTLPHRDREDNR